ncbi:UMP kinase [Candidatus Bipolaricaulota bacterium]|nr:UMP kinase [Candidatus Bipolaricaulota bacterium]
MGGPRRILVKLSGEMLKEGGAPFSPVALERVARGLAAISESRSETEVAVVIGGGNILRGAQSPWLPRVRADRMGMLATVLNALALQAYLEAVGRTALIQSAVPVGGIAAVDPIAAQAILSEGGIVIFAGGTGNPFVSTDTAAAIRAASIGAVLLAKASNVDGVYESDPNGSAKPGKPLKELTYDAFIAARYRVMDVVAVELCREHGIPIVVFDGSKATSLPALGGDGAWQLGTLIR